MKIKKLTVEQMLMLHGLVLAQTGGSVGVRDIGRLESAVSTQSQEVFGVELYASAYEKAAAMIRGIIADHPFVDANKRTGTLVGLTFLGLHDVHLTASNKQLEDFAVQIAIEHLSVEEIAIWLEANCILRDNR